MLIQFQEYLTFENIYLWSNFGVLPFWLLIIVAPNSRLTQILTNSVILPLIFSTIYVYLIYQIIILDLGFFEIFNLYAGIDDLYAIFSSENFLLIFWLHFLMLNLFLGTWVSRDAFKYNITKKIVFLPLVLIYFMGPVGLVVYWMFRIFYAKKLGFHD